MGKIQGGPNKFFTGYDLEIFRFGLTLHRTHVPNFFELKNISNKSSLKNSVVNVEGMANSKEKKFSYPKPFPGR